MKYNMYPVIESDDLEEAIKLQYDAEIDIVELFFPYGCENKEYLYILSEKDEPEDEDDFFSRQREMVRGFLRDTMPKNTEAVIIEFDF